MNVSLTFRAVFASIAIGLLIGCGSMKHYEFSRIDQTIELETNNLISLQNNLMENRTEWEKLSEYLNYVKSAPGKQLQPNGQCSVPISLISTPTPMPVHACETQKQREQLMGEKCNVVNNCDVVNGAVALNKLPISASYVLTTGCAASKTNKFLLENPEPIVDAITSTFCTVGLGKTPKWIKIPGPGKFAVNGALMVIRGVACNNTVNRFKHRIDNQHSCMVKAASDCNNAFLEWQGKEKTRLKLAQQGIQDELERCESITKRFSGLNPQTAQNKATSLEKHAKQIIANIEKAYRAVLDAHAIKHSAERELLIEQTYVPADPG